MRVPSAARSQIRGKLDNVAILQHRGGCEARLGYSHDATIMGGMIRWKRGNITAQSNRLLKWETKAGKLQQLVDGHSEALALHLNTDRLSRGGRLFPQKLDKFLSDRLASSHCRVLSIVSMAVGILASTKFLGIAWYRAFGGFGGLSVLVGCWWLFGCVIRFLGDYPLSDVVQASCACRPLK